jgi:hypothetical protein
MFAKHQGMPAHACCLVTGLNHARGLLRTRERLLLTLQVKHQGVSFARGSPSGLLRLGRLPRPGGRVELRRHLLDARRVCPR